MSKGNGKTKEYPIDPFFPAEGKRLIGGTGKQFIQDLGEDAAKKVVKNVLLGNNLRESTEYLTRRRLSVTSAAVVEMFIKGYAKDQDFRDNLSHLALKQVESSSQSDKERVWPAQWLLGLTGKSVQNVLRSKGSAFGSYVTEFEKALEDSAEIANSKLGSVSLKANYLEIGSPVALEASFNWLDILRITTAIGAQTLAIRGSDKSLYGKLFEKLILGSALTILGFSKVERGKVFHADTEKVFWLSDSSAEREADATALITLGKVARFDIGFIGSGNSEISKDKLSRFTKQVEISSGTATSTTFVVVDKLPSTSKTIEAAKSANAVIIQMSMSLWLKQLAEEMSKIYEIDLDILHIPDSEIEAYIDKKLVSIDVSQFASSISVSTEIDSSP